MDFFFFWLKITGLSLGYRGQLFRKYSFSSGTLANLPLPPSLQTLFGISTTLWAHLL